MYLDAQCLFTGTPTSANGAQGPITATAASTNIYDFGAYPGTVTNGAYEQGVGNSIKLFAAVITSFNNLTSLDVAVQTSVDAAFTTPITLSTKNYLLAVLTAGAQINPGTLAGITGVKRFLRLNFTVNGTAPTTGTIEAGITNELQANTPAPDLLGNS